MRGKITNIKPANGANLLGILSLGVHLQPPASRLAPPMPVNEAYGSKSQSCD